jgi:maltooligosyltrehalose synthase
VSMSQGYSPVDNNTYNLLQALVSKLEALAAYRTYEQDADQQTKQVFQQLIQEDQQHAQQLLQAVKQQLQKV